MAKRGKKNRAPLTEEQQRAKAIAKLFGKKDAKAASALADTFFAPESLGRVSTGFDAEGNRIFENQDVLDRMKAQRDTYFGGGRSADTQQGIDLSKSYLQGYSAPEFTAMRESASQGVDQQYQTGLRNLAKAQARGGARGAAVSAQNLNLDRTRLGEQKNLERDLFIAGADEKRRALDSYNRLIGDTEATEFDRSQSTQKTYADQLAATRNDELNRQQFNLGQVGAEKAGQYGAYFGALGFGEQKRAGKFSRKYGKKYLDILKQQADAYSKMASGGAPNYAGFAEEAKTV